MVSQAEKVWPTSSQVADFVLTVPADVVAAVQRRRNSKTKIEPAEFYRPLWVASTFGGLRALANDTIRRDLSLPHLLQV